jgi:hypothetical protein
MAEMVLNGTLRVSILEGMRPMKIRDVPKVIGDIELPNKEVLARWREGAEIVLGLAVVSFLIFTIVSIPVMIVDRILHGPSTQIEPVLGPSITITAVIILGLLAWRDHSKRKKT